MFPFGLQLKPFETLRHFPMNLEAFDIEKEKERDNKIFGIIKIKSDSKKHKSKREKKTKNTTVKNK
jgi:hypothetical protein